MLITILGLLKSLIFVGLGIILYKISLKVIDKEWRDIAVIFSVLFMVAGISGFIYSIISRLLT